MATSQKFIYVASSAFYMLLSIVKLGMTEDLYGRRSAYRTSCPPGMTPHSHDIEYIAVWETNAQTTEELYDQEDLLHNQFNRWRMMRSIPGDSEWFNFRGNPPLELIKEFMTTVPWVKCEVDLSKIVPLNRPSRHLRKQHPKNAKFLRSSGRRNEVLDEIQSPVIKAIEDFVQDARAAGWITAPCGSGKTRMTCKGVKGVGKIIIACPSNQIQGQWVSTLLFEGVFAENQILIIGSSRNGTTDQATIQAFMRHDTYCIITTYMSSALLVDLLTHDTELLILDEAHHLAGVVGKEDEGVGKTRRLMMKAAELEVKRLSLTFTPRFVRHDDAIHVEFASMDDTSIFGSKIAELKIRDLIHKGVLPDYRIWSLRDHSNKGSGILAKAECIRESWEAREMVRGVEVHILHHLIVFAATNEDAKVLEKYFNETTTDTLVLCVKGGDALKEPIRRFSEAKRAIIVNCKVLGEGVDIPIANAVAVTYPKHSMGEIIQMLLRAGRWYEGKSIFHILLPIVDNEDMSGFENTLTALASCDQQLCDEIIYRSKNPLGTQDMAPSIGNLGTSAECITIDDYDGLNLDDIRKCFLNIRKNLFPARESKRIQELCVSKGIDTSIEYSTTLLKEMPELPENPKPKTSTWYDFLHPGRVTRVEAQAFVTEVLEPNSLRVGRIYDEWLGVQPSDVKSRLPSVQHITDGYFGADYINFNSLLEKFGRRVYSGRR